MLDKISEQVLTSRPGPKNVEGPEYESFEGLPAFRTTKREVRSTPLAYDVKTARAATEIYNIFDGVDPDNGYMVSDSAALTQALILRGTIEYAKDLNGRRPEYSQLVHDIGERSCFEGPKFNEAYSDVYKYTRQAMFAKQWLAPESEFPLPGLGGCHTWLEWKDYLRRTLFFSNRPATPEVLIPPELLFPWRDALPTALEILETNDGKTEHSLNEDIVNGILDELLEPVKVIETPIDFALAHTNTNKCAVQPSLEQAKLASKNGQKVTGFKYEHVTKWLDSGMDLRRYEDYAIRTPVWKRPTEYRDATTNSPTLLWKVWKFNRQLHHSWSPKMMNYVGDTCDAGDLRGFGAKLKPGEHFLQADWKKSGLTMPHWFTRSVIKVLQRKNPSMNFDFPAGGWPILDPKTGKVFRPKEFGYGLGQVNNLYTLFNAVLFEYGKRTNVFNEEETILSFNDDSIIRVQGNKYNRWMNILRQSGGYPDEHKSFSSNGGQFCEMYTQWSSNSNFKWISFFHTLMQSMVKCHTYNHWRFNVTDIYSSADGWDLYDPGQWDRGILRAKLEDTLCIVIDVATRYWGVPMINITNPETNPTSIGFIGHRRGRTGPKKSIVTLVNAIDANVPRVQVALEYFMRVRQWMQYTPKFAPWREFPKGNTYRSFQLLSKMGGIFGHLDALGAKCRNEFIMDTDIYNEQVWAAFETQVMKYVPLSSHQPVYNYDFGDRFFEECDFSGYQIPEQWVTKWSTMPMEQPPPALIFNMSKSRYSEATMVHSYLVGCVRDEWQNAYVPQEEIRFDSNLNIYIPLANHVNCYKPMMSMEQISLFSQWNDPYIAQKDLWDRDPLHRWPLAIRGRDRKIEKALEFLRAADPKKYGNPDFIGATWWTKTPQPILPEDIGPITDILPCYHDAYFENVKDDINDVIDYDGASDEVCGIPLGWLNLIEYDDPDWIDTLISNRKVWISDRTHSHPNEDIAQPMTENISAEWEQMIALQNERISELWLQLREQVPLGQLADDVGAREFVDLFDITGGLEHEVPDWLGDLKEPSSDDEWDSEGNSDDEADLIAAALDNRDDDDSDVEWCPAIT
jgi:hypothetical protein